MDVSSPQAVAAIVGGSVAILVSIATSIITVVVAERRLRREHKLEFAAEAVAKQLLMEAEWSWRRFETIRHFLGGFEDDELRRILVRAGAVRAVSEAGDELWGLLSRNPDLGKARVVEQDTPCMLSVQDLYRSMGGHRNLPEFMKREKRPK
ncbi:MAG: hypothetical protein J7483_08800 [Novosphingobium sp.]|nr:hypothetical protein [Novosphingobium sp.]